MGVDIEKLFNRQLGVKELEEACLELEQVECPVEHLFAKGVYIRTMKAPAGTFAIGKRHRHQIVNIITKGRALVYSGDDVAKEIVGPCTFISEPFIKKMAFFLEDTEWINIHPTEETDIEIIEEEFIITDEKYLLYLEDKKQLEGGL